jgi:hypothetical protein
MPGFASEPRLSLVLRALNREDKIPDHSVFSRARHERFRESDMFRRVFERVVEACIACVYRKLVRFDLTTESLNVDRNGRADILPLEPVRLDLQAQEPT